MSATDRDELLAWLAERKIPLASKQDMVNAGLNVFGFDLAMESFNRRATAMPGLFAYAHENGVLLFIRRPRGGESASAPEDLDGAECDGRCPTCDEEAR